MLKATRLTCAAALLVASCGLAMAQASGAGAARPALLVRLPALLPRPLERRRLWPVLDADADRTDVELRDVGAD